MHECKKNRIERGLRLWNWIFFIAPKFPIKLEGMARVWKRFWFSLNIYQWMNELLTSRQFFVFTTDNVSPFHISYPMEQKSGITKEQKISHCDQYARHICCYMTLCATVLVSWISTSFPHFSYSHFDQISYITHHTCAFYLAVCL